MTDKTIRTIKPGVGRLVSGHPMVRTAVTDKHDKPLLSGDGTPRTSAFLGMAYKKGAETDWRQTAWGAEIYAAGSEQGAYPAESQNAAFSWKVIDGDSAEPNRKMKKPCDQEGYPGHWIIYGKTELPFSCFHRGKYNPLDAIANKAEIKRGDYLRVGYDVTNNRGKNGAAAETAGVYVNPVIVELYQAGVAIATAFDRDGAEFFGEDAGQLPEGAQIDPHVGLAPAAGGAPAGGPAPAPKQAPAPAPKPGGVQQAEDFLDAPKLYSVEGKPWTEAQLLAAGWEAAAIAALPLATS